MDRARQHVREVEVERVFFAVTVCCTRAGRAHITHYKTARKGGGVTVGGDRAVRNSRRHSGPKPRREGVQSCYQS